MVDEKIVKLTRMLEDRDHRLRAIQKLEALGEAAHAAVPNLWQVVQDVKGDSRPDMRAAALRAMVTIDGPQPEIVQRLLDRLKSDPSDEVALQAAQSFGQLGTAVKAQLQLLLDLLTRERNLNVRSAIAQAIVRIDGNTEQLFEDILRALQKLDPQLLGITAILSEMELSADQQSTALTILWDIIHRNPPTEIVDPIFLAIVNITADDDAVLEILLSDNQIDTQTKVFAMTEPKLWNNVIKAFNSPKQSRLLETMLDVIVLDNTESDHVTPRKDLDKLNALRKDILRLLNQARFDAVSLQTICTAMEKCLAQTGLGLGFLYKSQQFDVIRWLREHRTPFPGIGEFLIFEADDNLWDQQWENDPEATVSHIIELITKTNLANWQSNHVYQVLDKLKGKKTELSREMCEKALPKLRDAKAKASQDPFREFREYLVGQTLEVIQQRLEKLEKEDLLKDIQNEQEPVEERIKKIKQFAQIQSTEALRGLVDVWVNWLDQPERAALSETTAEALRFNRLSVLPLVDQLAKTNLSSLHHRRIAHLLADMSDPRFYEQDRLDEYNAMQEELSKHAIPTLARLLPSENDIDLRENLARALANLGGREAVDALVRAIIDEEKKRAARQDLLAEYYLKPSKDQSEAAAHLLSGAVSDAKNTLKILQILNITVVAVGIVILIVGIFTSLVNQDAATRVIGGLASLGGLAGVLIQLIKNPLDRIQNAMANLVQIETAFTSFIWELNLNGTYIQSQYVAEGKLTNESIDETVNRIESAMNLAMNLVAIYTKEGRQRIVTRINSLSPAAGEVGRKIIIHGQHLQGDNSQKKETNGIVAINHIPIAPDNLSWNENAVSFILPATIPGLDNKGTTWLSLIVDGMETNALPFHITNTLRLPAEPVLIMPSNPT